MLDHGVGTVFGETAEIGDDCYVKLATMFSSALIARWLKTLSKGAREQGSKGAREQDIVALLPADHQEESPFWFARFTHITPALQA